MKSGIFNNLFLGGPDLTRPLRSMCPTCKDFLFFIFLHILRIEKVTFYIQKHSEKNKAFFNLEVGCLFDTHKFLLQTAWVKTTVFL